MILVLLNYFLCADKESSKENRAYAAGDDCRLVDEVLSLTRARSQVKRLVVRRQTLQVPRAARVRVDASGIKPRTAAVIHDGRLRLCRLVTVAVDAGTDAVIKILSDKLLQVVDPKTPMTAAFKCLDEILLHAVRTLLAAFQNPLRTVPTNFAD